MVWLQESVYGVVFVHPICWGRTSASGHPYYGGAEVRGSYTLKEECSNKDYGGFLLYRYLGKKILVSLLLSYTYFKHYLYLSLNVLCLLLVFIECLSCSTSLLGCFLLHLIRLRAYASYHDHLVYLVCFLNYLFFQVLRLILV